MIREKQRTEIARKFGAALNMGQVPRPDLAKHVALALASGESPKLKPAAAIVKAGRIRLVNDGYSNRHNLTFVDVFASTNGYETEMAQFERYEAGRQKLLKPLKRLADKLNLRAMSGDADAETIVDEFDEALAASGLEDYVRENRPAYLKPALDDDGDDD